MPNNLNLSVYRSQSSNVQTVTFRLQNINLPYNMAATDIVEFRDVSECIVIWPVAGLIS